MPEDKSVPTTLRTVLFRPPYGVDVSRIQGLEVTPLGDGGFWAIYKNKKSKDRGFWVERQGLDEIIDKGGWVEIPTERHD